MEFENSHGHSRAISEFSCDTEQEADAKAMEQICNFCNERNFRIYYVRSWMHGSCKIFDVGSHTEFFHLCKQPENT